MICLHLDIPQNESSSTYIERKMRTLKICEMYLCLYMKDKSEISGSHPFCFVHTVNTQSDVKRLWSPGQEL